MLKKPKYCMISLGFECPLRCKMCFMWKVPRNEKEIGLPEWKKFIEELSLFLDYPIEVNILGGEPLLKDYIYELISFIRTKGLRVSMPSSGFLINQKVAGMIAKAGLNTLGISLDSLREETHDSIRGVKGVYKKVMGAVDYIYQCQSECKTDILTIIMNENLSDILPLADWVNQNEKIASINFMAIMQPHCSETDKFWYRQKEYSFLWPSETERVHEIIDQLILLKKKGYKITNPVSQLEMFKVYFENPVGRFVRDDRCNFDEIVLNVSSGGDVYLCWNMDPIGNIKNETIENIWSSAKAAQVREEIKHCRRNCEPMINCFYGD